MRGHEMPRCPGFVVPGNSRGLVGGCCQRSLCHSKRKPFSHRGQAVTVNERDVVRENEEKRCERQASKDLRVSRLKALFL